jgi:feruloyl esterase
LPSDEITQVRQEATVLILILAGACNLAPADQPCESLAALALPDTTVTLAEPVAAGSFLPPRPSRTAAGRPGPDFKALPGFCRVAASIKPTADSDIRIEVWIPSRENWNGKFTGLGSGGLGGTIDYGALVAALARGYASATTDTGHDESGPAGSFALGHPEKVIDYGYRSTHLTAVIGKEIVARYFGRAATHAYFSGCSQGGQEALMEAQRFPTDYDGIIAGDPDYNQTHHEVGAHLWVLAALFGNTGATLSADAASLVGNAVNEACDALDGVRDGVLENPRLCHFDPGVLQCKGAAGPNCLTAPQVEAIRKLWAGPDGATVGGYYPGLERGGEANTWRGWIASPSPETNGHGTLGIPFFKYFVFGNPDWDFRTFNFKTEPPALEQKLATALDATDADLAPFERRGGKLIQYHGFSDPDVPPGSSIHYYENVVRTLGGQARVDTFYRLFMVPGMGHCSGGPGATSFDMLQPLEQWVEQQRAPAKIIASRMNEGLVSRTRPLCPYPQEAHYRGTGSTDDWRNFDCKAP